MFFHIDNLQFFFPSVIGGAIIYIKEDFELCLNESFITALKVDARVYWWIFSFTNSYNTETTH